MRIEHIAMYVHDLEGARNFFVKYFNAGSNEGYHNKKGIHEAKRRILPATLLYDLQNGKTA